MDLTRPSPDRRALLRDELPSDPDDLKRGVRMLERAFSMEPVRDWALVDELNAAKDLPHLLSIADRAFRVEPEPVDYERFGRGIRNGVLLSIPIWLLIIAAIAFLVAGCAAYAPPEICTIEGTTPCDTTLPQPL